MQDVPNYWTNRLSLALAVSPRLASSLAHTNGRAATMVATTTATTRAATAATAATTTAATATKMTTATTNKTPTPMATPMVGLVPELVRWAVLANQALPNYGRRPHKPSKSATVFDADCNGDSAMIANMWRPRRR